MKTPVIAGLPFTNPRYGQWVRLASLPLLEKKFLLVGQTAK